MRRFIFLAALLFSIRTHAQFITLEQADGYANELVKNGFLTPKGKDVLLQEMRKSGIEVEHRSIVKPVTYTSSQPSRETILQFCAVTLSAELSMRLNTKDMPIEQAITPKEPLDDSLGRTYSLMNSIGGVKAYEGCIAPTTSIFGYTRMKTLTTFHRSGLIDDQVFNDATAALRSKQLRDEVVLMQFLLERSSFYRFYDRDKKEQQEYIKRLAAHGLLTDEGTATVLNSYQPYELKTLPEILAYSPRYAHVDLHAYAPDPQKTYPVIFAAVKKLLPPFRYTNLTVEVLSAKESELIREDVRLSFTVDTVRYVQTFFHNFRKPKPEPHDPVLEAPRVDEDFHKGINKWLTDIGSPFRLYTINILDSDERAYGNRSVGLLLLKQGEDSLISTDRYVMSREVFNDGLSRRNIDRLLNDLGQHGFFRHLTKTEIDSAKAKVAAAEINSIADVLLRFPRTIVAFDWETGNLANPYAQLTRELAAASRGAFQVSAITDEFVKGWKGAKKVRYGFTLNGKRYETLLKFDNDWLDPGFIELLATALKAQKIDGAFYHCIDDGQAGGFIFLSREQHKFIESTYPALLETGD